MAEGRDAEVYDIGQGLVARRFRDASRSCEHEAAIMTWARDHGVPVPEVKSASGPELVMTRVQGPSMLEAIGKQPWALQRHARQLATLHQQLHTVPAPPFARRPFDRGDALIHLDLHPLNVLIGEDGPVIIDWTNACAGPGALDEAYTWVLVRTSQIPGPVWQQRLLRLAQPRFPALLRRVPADRAARDSK